MPLYLSNKWKIGVIEMVHFWHASPAVGHGMSVCVCVCACAWCVCMHGVCMRVHDKVHKTI